MVVFSPLDAAVFELVAFGFGRPGGRGAAAEIHGPPDSTFSAMTAGFIYLSPFLVGAVTVYVAERTTRRTWSYYVRASMLANAIYELGTLLILIEGMICSILIIPVFSLMGALG